MEMKGEEGTMGRKFGDNKEQRHRRWILIAMISSTIALVLNTMEIVERRGFLKPIHLISSDQQ